MDWVKWHPTAHQCPHQEFSHQLGFPSHRALRCFPRKKNKAKLKESAGGLCVGIEGVIHWITTSVFHAAIGCHGQRMSEKKSSLKALCKEWIHVLQPRKIVAWFSELYMYPFWNLQLRPDKVRVLNCRAGFPLRNAACSNRLIDHSPSHY